MDWLSVVQQRQIEYLDCPMTKTAASQAFDILDPRRPDETERDSNNRSNEITPRHRVRKWVAKAIRTRPLTGLTFVKRREHTIGHFIGRRS